jgi:phytoene synthase
MISVPPAPADIASCRDLLRNGSRTFLAASLLLPRAVREPACVLYAFCRLADDAVDGDAGRADAVARLRQRLAQVYAGAPQPVAADRALAAVVAHFAIPRALPEALLEGFEWDAAGRRYHTLDDLQAYAARVAGSVGAMMAVLMGVRSYDGLARACDLGVAMQMSNIARDVGEDARMGRLYLPLQWLAQARIDPDAWLARPVFGDALGAVVQRLLQTADGLYRRVDSGVAQLPLACRPGINAARLLYAEIGHEVARHGLNSVDRRAVVPVGRKAWLLGQALLPARPRRPVPIEPALAATRFLVEAVAPTGVATSVPEAPASGATPVPLGVSAPVQSARPRRGFDDQVAWVVELFERLERRDRQSCSSGALQVR